MKYGGNIMRKAINILLIGIFIFSIGITGCSSSKNKEKKKSDKNTINFATFYSDDEQGAVYKEIAAAFEKKEGIKVEVTTDYSDDKIKEALSEKGGVDIIGLRRDQVIEYSKSGFITDLSDFIEEKELSKKLYDISIAYGKYNGKTYGIGDMPITLEWFYNIDMLKKYNIQEPTNLDELISISKKLKSKNIIPVEVGAMDGWTLATLFGSITTQTAAITDLTSSYGGDAKAFEDIPGMEEAFTIFGKLSSNSIPKNSIDINYRQSVDDFINGKVAFLPAISSAANLIEQIKPAGLNYQVLETPISFVEKPISKVSASAGQVIALPTNSKKGKDAQKFLEFLFSEEAQKIITDKGYMSSLITANNKENKVKGQIASHLEISNDNSIFIIDNLEAKMGENTVKILQDILEGRLKGYEGWSRTLKLTFQ